ncbi:hypothetical protein CR162_07485 [Pseudoroseomonas rhizosphaerae]|uniref:DUF1330 domain-containing protein n=1 Tax=Teichococcus rhizosphaerae TaxID=1335062 RepID=A0A2C7ABA1_9PROT|nr:DUF1330 domain-containing protein [Pseudoroseomonas rhizosphaerae]PHK95680.1 hypothetical protein CR162_07485 [Pseudoroseomonas rhizosphaerae]
MTCYAVGLLHAVQMGPGIVAYLEGIDATLAPYGGRFVIHGGPQEALEGACDRDLIVIAFPDRAAARAWYGSPGYRAILPHRLRHARGEVFLIEGMGEGHRATDILRGA